MRNLRQQTQSHKCLKLISIPIKALTKARDLCVRSINGCAAPTRTSAGSFPRTRSLSSSSTTYAAASFSRRSLLSGDDDYSELIRAASTRSLGYRNEIDMFMEMQKMLRQKKTMTTARGGLLPTSCSVGMARIEEEEGEDEYEEDEEGQESLNLKVSEKYPRSRSYAV